MNSDVNLLASSVRATDGLFRLQANEFTWPGIAYISIGCIIVYVIAFAVGLGQLLISSFCR